MKIAIILTAAALLFIPSLAAAQSAANPRADKAAHMDSTRPHGAAASSAQAATENDRAIDAELKRIDRMMTICTGC